MVSFTCNNCQDVVKKPKVQNHANSCGSYSFTCVDCMHVFDLDSIKAHTSCVTEEDKYQGKWKQKLSTNNSSNTNAGGAPPRGIERPPRAPMNDLTSSDDEDEDWVKKPSSKPAKAAAAAAPKATATASGRSARKHPRPGVSPSSDDEEEDRAVRPVKKVKTAAARSPSTTPKTKPKTPVVEAKHAPPHAEETRKKSDAASVEPTSAHPGKKDTPLLLPRSTTSTECIVPSFVLGTSEEVADIVRDVLAERGVAAMRGKDLALALVDRYAKRVAKSVRHAVDTAAELGTLKVEKNGDITLA